MHAHVLETSGLFCLQEKPQWLQMQILKIILLKDCTNSKTNYIFFNFVLDVSKKHFFVRLDFYKQFSKYLALKTLIFQTINILFDVQK